MSENIINVTDATFSELVLQSDLPVLVDFWAPWCGPCRMLTPTLEKVAGGFAGKLKFAKMNVDENAITPSTYNVRSIPTLIIFKAGQSLAVSTGALSEAHLLEYINANI